MLTRKPCKHCGSFYHSKNKCPNSPDKPLKAVYKAKGTDTPLSSKDRSNRPRLAYKGQSERSQLIGYADKFFGLYIRTRGGDGSYNQCYTCAAIVSYDDIQCGHFINRRFLKVRWDVINCNPQCNDCNVNKNGNLDIYERKLRLQYGNDTIDGLIRTANGTEKVTNAYIQLIIDKYQGVVF